MISTTAGLMLYSVGILITSILVTVYLVRKRVNYWGNTSKLDGEDISGIAGGALIWPLLWGIAIIVTVLPLPYWIYRGYAILKENKKEKENKANQQKKELDNYTRWYKEESILRCAVQDELNYIYDNYTVKRTAIKKEMEKKND